jgi:hypothetical protein
MEITVLRDATPCRIVKFHHTFKESTASNFRNENNRFLRNVIHVRGSHLISNVTASQPKNGNIDELFSYVSYTYFLSRLHEKFFNL